MTSIERQVLLKEIEIKLDDLSRQGLQGDGGQERTMADLMMIARRCAAIYDDLASTPRERYVAKAVEAAIAEAEEIVTGTPVGV